MSFRILTIALLLPLIASSVVAQINNPAHLNGEVKWNPFDPKHVDNPTGQEIANEHEEQGSNPEQGIADSEDNQNQ